MRNEKLVSTPLAIHFKRSKEMFQKTQEEIEYMSKVPYSSTIGSLMYAMVCTRTNIAHGVVFVSRYMNNPGRELEGSTVDYQVFERYHFSCIMFWRFRHCSIGIC